MTSKASRLRTETVSPHNFSLTNKPVRLLNNNKSTLCSRLAQT
nr:MAG TPA: hypothetical protein [Caudoviricetes sp.]